MTQEELENILKLHKEWLYNRRRNGKRAKFTETLLFNLNFSHANLCSVDFSGTIFNNTNFNNANLSNANFENAILDNTTLKNAKLFKTLGNGKEIKTIQTELYWVNITKDVIQIGCEQYTHEEWFNFSDKDILKMDGKKALKWWRIWKPIFKQIIEVEFKEI